MKRTEHDVWGYREDLARLARYLCRHPEDAEDVAHNALIKAAEKLDGFRGEASVKTWLHAVTSNECRMLRRRRQVSSLDDLFDRVTTDGELLADPDTDPEDMTIELETRREVLEALSRLPERYRCALILKDGSGRSLTETAELMDTTVSGIKSLLYRARAALREEIDDPSRPVEVV